MTSLAQPLHDADQRLSLDSTNGVTPPSGALARHVAESGVTGLTSNATILGYAMAVNHDYDDSLRSWVAQMKIPGTPATLRATLGLGVAQKACVSRRALLATGYWQSSAAHGIQPQRVPRASTSIKDSALAAPSCVEGLTPAGTIDTVPETTLLAIAEDRVIESSLTNHPATAVQALTAVRATGVDLDVMAKSLQRQSATALSAHGAALNEATTVKASGAGSGE